MLSLNYILLLLKKKNLMFNTAVKFILPPTFPLLAKTKYHWDLYFKDLTVWVNNDRHPDPLRRKPWMSKDLDMLIADPKRHVKYQNYIVSYYADFLFRFFVRKRHNFIFNISYNMFNRPIFTVISTANYINSAELAKIWGDFTNDYTNSSVYCFNKINSKFIHGILRTAEYDIFSMSYSKNIFPFFKFWDGKVDFPSGRMFLFKPDAFWKFIKINNFNSQWWLKENDNKLMCVIPIVETLYREKFLRQKYFILFFYLLVVRYLFKFFVNVKIIDFTLNFYKFILKKKIFLMRQVKLIINMRYCTIVKQLFLKKLKRDLLCFGVSIYPVKYTFCNFLIVNYRAKYFRMCCPYMAKFDGFCGKHKKKEKSKQCIAIVKSKRSPFFNLQCPHKARKKELCWRHKNYII